MHGYIISYIIDEIFKVNLYFFQSWDIPSRQEGVVPRSVNEWVIQKSGQENVARGVCSTLYNALKLPPMEAQLDAVLLPSMEAMTVKPQFHKLWSPLNTHKKTVMTKFGPVPYGSVLSYQLKETEKSHGDNLVFSKVLRPSSKFPVLEQRVQVVLNYGCQLQYESVMLSAEDSTAIEEQTLAQSDCSKWYDVRKKRLTSSNFKKVCSRRGKFETLAEQMCRPNNNFSTAAMKRGQELEPKAAEMYSTMFGRNVYRCGIFINPMAPHLGCSPDRIVYDEEAALKFGLLEIKCPDVDFISDCSYLKQTESGSKQKEIHQYYYQIMGQMGITGHPWCDLFVMGRIDTHCERIYFSQDVFNSMKDSLDQFYFDYFLQALASTVNT